MTTIPQRLRPHSTLLLYPTLLLSSVLTMPAAYAAVIPDIAAPLTASDINAKPDTVLSQLSLAQALKIALAANRDLKLSQIAIDSAAAAKIIAGAAPNPTLTIQTAGMNPKLGIGAGTLRDKTVDTTFRIDQLIERGGKRDLRLQGATHLETSAKFDNEGQLRQLRLATSFAYFDLMAAQGKFSIANELRSIFRTTLSTADLRKKTGDIAGADAARVKVDAMRAENDARQAANDLFQAQSSLLSLLSAQSAPSDLRAIDAWADIAAADAQLLYADIRPLIAQRADVKSAQARLDAALSARQLALAAKTRDVSVGLQFEHYPVSPTNTLGSGNSFGISVQIPLFARYAYQGEISLAEKNVDSAREILEKTKENARFELLNIQESARSAQEKVQRFQQELLQAARQSASAAEFAFKNGAIGVTDLLDARRIYRTTELDAINAQADYAKALSALRISIQEVTTP
ncbi:TolC family protein [Undibacterium sp. CY7W]|uniref:TolC family protein n=1 Tax=Undibacterium rugosum TaxID=2762291 RepID=A0A923I481_9BURK|nr:TolC family protein [Undibacterium rugosum]MBC3936857.1 TolC family protein [Undibacterium rugosum]